MLDASNKERTQNYQGRGGVNDLYLGQTAERKFLLTNYHYVMLLWEEKASLQLDTLYTNVIWLYLLVKLISTVGIHCWVWTTFASFSSRIVLY